MFKYQLNCHLEQENYYNKTTRKFKINAVKSLFNLHLPFKKFSNATIFYTLYEKHNYAFKLRNQSSNLCATSNIPKIQALFQDNN